MMASPAQILANRSNAQFSTGPRAEEGKRASSGNSRRHGLTGTQIVMPSEDLDEYDQLLQGGRPGKTRKTTAGAGLLLGWPKLMAAHARIARGSRVPGQARRRQRQSG